MKCVYIVKWIMYCYLYIIPPNRHQQVVTVTYDQVFTDSIGAQKFYDSLKIVENYSFIELNGKKERVCFNGSIDSIGMEQRMEVDEYYYSISLPEKSR